MNDRPGERGTDPPASGEPWGAPNQPQHPQPQYPQPQYPSAPGGHGGPSAPNSGKSVAVLILGIASLVLMVTCGLGFVASIAALVVSGGAKREIQQSNGALGGEQLIKVGLVLSWITLGLTILVVVVVAAVLVVLTAG